MSSLFNKLGQLSANTDPSVKTGETPVEPQVEELVEETLPVEETTVEETQPSVTEPIKTDGDLDFIDLISEKTEATIRDSERQADLANRLVYLGIFDSEKTAIHGLSSLDETTYSQIETMALAKEDLAISSIGFTLKGLSKSLSNTNLDSLRDLVDQLLLEISRAVTSSGHIAQVYSGYKSLTREVYSMSVTLGLKYPTLAKALFNADDTELYYSQVMTMLKACGIQANLHMSDNESLRRQNNVLTEDNKSLNSELELLRSTLSTLQDRQKILEKDNFLLKEHQATPINNSPFFISVKVEEHHEDDSKLKSNFAHKSDPRMLVRYLTKVPGKKGNKIAHWSYTSDFMKAHSFKDMESAIHVVEHMKKFKKKTYETLKFQVSTMEIFTLARKV